jgi:hypothetical protein
MTKHNKKVNDDNKKEWRKYIHIGSNGCNWPR